MRSQNREIFVFLPSQVSAMKQGLLPISHDALLAGDMVYFDFNGEMEGEADRIELQKCLGPTCKVRPGREALSSDAVLDVN